MKKFIINGGKVLSGEITVSGNKNAVLPMIAAAVLTDEEVILHNVPNIVDVRIMLEIAVKLGIDVSFTASTLRLKAAKIINSKIPRELCSKVRTSILFAGPLCARCGQATTWPPGGDVIGRRRLDSHFYGLSSLGVELEVEGSSYNFRLKQKMTGRDLFLDEASVTGTEQIIMAAVIAEGQTIIRNAASEPHVTDLAELLIAMGAKISGLGSNTLTIDGVDKLHGAEHTISGDHIEAGSFLALAAATGGGITINGITPRHYWMTRRIFERFGIKFEMEQNRIIMPAGQQLHTELDFGGHTPVISDGPWPQFPSDMMSCMIVAATQAKGSVLFFEKMFESRIYFVDRLIGMGANIIVCDPHRVVISGPAKLRGSSMASPDIRAGMAMLIAALCADGTSEISNADIIERGYDNLVEKIKALGGEIRVDT
jgi:UDP-N-acetylglucosamine 1-carboxyvinyltransferase